MTWSYCTIISCFSFLFFNRKWQFWNFILATEINCPTPDPHATSW
jgi:hypothetical protein